MATTKKTPAKKTTAKKATAKKATAKKATAKKATAKKATANKAVKTAARQTTKRTGGPTKSSAGTSKKRPATRAGGVRSQPAKKSASARRPPRRDAIAMLKADHQHVSDLFDKFDGLGRTAHKTRQATVATIIEELSVHAGIEETVFYPAMRERLAARDEDQVLEALEEHHVVKILLSELQSMASNDERYTAKVTVLSELVGHHVDEEESEMFKHARRIFSRAELVELADELDAAKSTAPSRPHPESPDTPPGNIVSNVITAPLDAASGVASRASKAVHGLID